MIVYLCACGSVGIEDTHVRARAHTHTQIHLCVCGSVGIEDTHVRARARAYTQIHLCACGCVGSDPLRNMAGGDVSEAHLDGGPGGAVQRGAAAAGRLALHHLLLLTGAPFAQAIS